MIQSSIIIAKILGPYMAIVCLAMLFNKNSVKRLYAIFANEGAIILGGTFSLLSGILIIHFHNIWLFGWPLIITIFGWLAFLKGLFLLFFPSKTLKMILNINDSKFTGIGLVVGLILGLYLSYSALI